MRYTEAHAELQGVINSLSHAQHKLRELEEDVSNVRRTVLAAETRLATIDAALTERSTDPAWRELAAVKIEVDSDVAQVKARSDELLAAIRQDTRTG
jgi:predicted  nucleic acid-binding Zn-ribbon protein